MELASAAWCLGVPHPTGYPLYMMLGYAWMHALGWMDPGGALTLFSAACVSAAIAIMVALLREVVRARGTMGTAWIGLTGLYLAGARTVWEHATFTEVYPLTLALGVWLTWKCWKINSNENPPTLWAAGWLGFIAGLLALNHYSGIAFAPLALMTLVAGARRSGNAARFVILFFVVFIFMLGGYLYLPLRAQANPPLNWGDPSNWERMAWMLRGGQFRDLNVQMSGGAIATGIAHWLDWWRTQWFFRPGAAEESAALAGAGIVFLGPAVAGLFLLRRTQPVMAWGLLASVAATGFFGAVYHIIDIDAYFLPAIPAAGVGWTMFGKWLGAKMAGLIRPRGAMAVTAAGLFFSTLVHYPWINISGDKEPLLWGDRVMELAPRDAMVLTLGDYPIFLLWYQQIVLGKREDVIVFGSNFIFSGWYEKYFEREGRPEFPRQIEDRPIPMKADFDLALFSGTLLPNMREGREIYMAYSDPAIDHFFSTELVAPLLTPEYVGWFSDRFPKYQLSPYLFRLTRNPRIESMSVTELAWELRRFYSDPRNMPADYHLE